jgi:ribosomal protein S18 acetylase RimI-like enzyme
MFASIDLARRIEAAEANMMRALAERARAAGHDVELRPVGTGVATFVRPGSPMNKVIGIGFDGPVDEHELDAIEAAWRDRGSPVQVELSTLARFEAAQQFAARGYELQAFENVLGADPAAFAGAPSSLRVERTETDLDEWIERMADSFLQADGTGAGSPDAFAKSEVMTAMREMAGAPGLRRYLVAIDGVMAGGASMRLDPERVAQMCGAATAPPFRRRGVQSALLEARLRDAAAANCDVAVITTMPGSKSQQNAQRQGFHLLYARAILVKQPA